MADPTDRLIARGVRPIDEFHDEMMARAAADHQKRLAKQLPARRIAEAALAAVEAALGDTLLPAAREEALAGILAILPEPADRAEWDALCRETDQLRKDGAQLHDRAERIDAELKQLRTEVEQWRATFGRDALPGALRRLERAEADRAAVLHEEADRIDATRADFPIAVQNGITWATAELRRHAAECPECGTTGACNGGPCPLRRMADETATEPTQPDSTTLLELVRDFLDPDPCSFDHHGYCQAHGYLGGEPMSCPHGRARKLLAALEQPAAGARQDGADS